MYLNENKARVKQFFGFDWYFRHAGEQADEQADEQAGEQADEHTNEPDAETSAYRPVQLPHDWSIEYPFDENAATFGSGGYVKVGTGWYKKKFYVSPINKDRHVTLMFDGAYMNARVTLNGKVLGEHVYGYTPFEFDITNELDYEGENELEVRVDNSQQPNSRWYSGSGITREVWLRSLSAEHIPTNGTYIATKTISENVALINITTKIERKKPDPALNLTTTILDNEGNIRTHEEVSLPTPVLPIPSLPTTNPTSTDPTSATPPPEKAAPPTPPKNTPTPNPPTPKTP